MLGDTVAVIGDNRKMLIFPLDQVPEMARGRGVRLQKYKDGGLSDIAVFDAKAGLTWKDSARPRVLRDHQGARRVARAPVRMPAAFHRRASRNRTSSASRSGRAAVGAP